MTYILLDEINQTYSYPPVNKGSICNYNISNDLLKADGYVDIDDNLIDLFNQDKAIIKNDAIVDISNSDEYKAKVIAKSNAAKKAELQDQINALDLKSIRAIREGGIYDEKSDQTWLDYYTAQIKFLRDQIANL